MPCHCGDIGLDEMFDDRFARKDADRYRRRGLPPRARLLLTMIRKAVGLDGITTLEGGAGAGALTVDLSRKGVSSARGIDAMPVAIDHARMLAREFGVANRATFDVGDFADASSLSVADVVILDRVVCCYPDWRALISNATRSAQRAIALTYPRKNAMSSGMVRLMNTAQRLFRRRFRMYLHEPADMMAQLEQQGFVRGESRRYWFWELSLLLKTPSA